VGDDLNQVFRTNDAFIAPFCTTAHTGDKWRAVLRVVAAGQDFVFPDGYEPSRLPLDEDFLAKFASARYVIDAGTRQQRVYVFSAREHVFQAGGLPDGSRFVRWVTRSLDPLAPGHHAVDEYVTMTAAFWDGFDVVPEVNLLPAGESLAGSVDFVVAHRR
jgi:hypothetical protein